MIKLIFAERHTRLHFIVFDAMAGLSLPEKKETKSEIETSSEDKHATFDVFASMATREGAAKTRPRNVILVNLSDERRLVVITKW